STPERLIRICCTAMVLRHGGRFAAVAGQSLHYNARRRDYSGSVECGKAGVVIVLQCPIGIVVSNITEKGAHMKKQFGLLAVLGLAVVAFAAEQAGKTYKTD